MTRALSLLLAAVASASACKSAEVVEGFPDSFVGVGMELKIEGDEPVVVRTLPGGSAAEAGLMPGDRLTAIDGRPTRGESLGDVVMRIRGRPGSQITLALRRSEQRLFVVVRRRQMTKGTDDYLAE